jgi:adenylosuccinate lyase
MLRSMAMSHNLVHAQRVMLALVEKGMLREAAYDLVQRLAMESWAKECDYKALLAADPEVSARLSAADLDALCRPENSYGHIDEIFERELGADGR